MLTLPLRVRAATARGRAKRVATLAKISANVAADRTFSDISPEQFMALPPKDRQDIRFAGGRADAARIRRLDAEHEGRQFNAAIRAYFNAYPKHKTDPKATTAKIAGELWNFHFNYFPDGRPHLKWDAFLKKVRLVLAKINPKHRAS